MKRIISIILICLPICVSAQIPELSALGSEYELTKGVTVMHLEGEMLKASLGEKADLITSIDVIASTTAATTTEIFDKATAIINRYNIEPTIKTQSGDANVMIYTTKAHGMITDIVVIVKQSSNGVISVISGSIPEERLDDYVQVTM